MRNRVIVVAMVMSTLMACGGAKQTGAIYRIDSFQVIDGVRISLDWLVIHPGGDYQRSLDVRRIGGRHIDPRGELYGRIFNLSGDLLEVQIALAFVNIVVPGTPAITGGLYIDLGEGGGAIPVRDQRLLIPNERVRPFKIRLTGDFPKEISTFDVIIPNIFSTTNTADFGFTFSNTTMSSMESVPVGDYGELPSRNYQEILAP